MKRLVFALALVAVVGACKKAAPPASGAADSTKMMMSDSTHMMADSTKMMDSTKH